MPEAPDQTETETGRVRLTRAARHRQLVDVSWRIVREQGTDALTLGRLAELAGVTKPVVYDQFRSRNGLLATLYREFDDRQTAVIDAALAASGPALESKAEVVATSYIDCVLLQGREIPGVIAALSGSAELEKIKRDYHLAFIEKCRSIFAPFAASGAIPAAGLWAMLGAAEAVSHAAAVGDLTPEQAANELTQVVIAMVHRA